MVVRADRLARRPLGRRRHPSATRSSRRSPGCAGRWADPSVIVSGDGGYRLAVEPDAVDALCVLRDAATASRRLDAGDVRGAAEVSAAALRALPRRGAALDRRLGRAAPGTARRGAREAHRDPALGAGATGRRRDRRAGGRRRDLPLPGRAVGAADHRAVPGGPPGRRARRATSGSAPGSPTSSASSPDRGCRSSSDRSSTTTRDSAFPIVRAGREPAVAVIRARRTRRARSPSCPSCSAASASSRSSGPGASGRRRSPSRPAARCPACPAASGWSGSKPRRRRTTSSTR